MTRETRHQQGQSIVEYLVLATVVILAILAIRGTMNTKIAEVFDTTAERIGDAADLLAASK